MHMVHQDGICINFNMEEKTPLNRNIKEYNSVGQRDKTACS